MNIERTECLKSWIRSGIILGWRKELLISLLVREAEGGDDLGGLKGGDLGGL